MTHDDEYTSGPEPMPIWTRPRVRVATTYRAASYAPEMIEVEIDADDVSATDIVSMINAMAFVAYGPIATPNGSAPVNRAEQLSLSLME
jgi:hypothetical protein